MDHPEHFTGPWHVEYPEKLKQYVKDAAEAWLAFCELEESTQDLFKTSNHFDGTGFERKTGDASKESAHSKDRKLNFDITRSGIDALANVAQSVSGAKGEVVNNFIHSAGSLATEVQPAIIAVGSLIEKQSKTKDFESLARSSGPDAFFRFLYYPEGAETNSIIGEPHPDNSGFTLHLYESTDGCEWLDTNKKTWHPLPVKIDSASAFPSMQTQLATGGEVDALWHRIIANETTTQFGRVAIVCFVSLKGAPKYDRNQHGRLQEFDLGKTYGMDPEEFSQLFKS